ncbi:MAG: ATP phosphoribosyltransferase regulatory subunit, partial [Rhodospirillales bacterium]|nr:ATP phosphoribosyltransferase regulatory subunit [Rhodospirillales bacterium]
ALLPAGMCDVLPPDAAFEAETTERLMAFFGAFGYQRVKPPMIEFEDSLLTDNGAAMASQSFRLMDPVSQRMMALRPDMTLQVARIATTRLSDDPRPLRLSYAGQVLRVKGSSLRPERQFSQVGAELIGSPSPSADAEIITMAAHALISMGVRDLSVDLGMPLLVKMLAGELCMDISRGDGKLRAALDRKDGQVIAALGGRAAVLFGGLLSVVGPAKGALEALQALDLPEIVRGEITHLAQVIELLGEAVPDLKLTVDPVELRGYEYHTGITFTFFSLGLNQELGRGGRYLAGMENGNTEREPATGITFFLDCVAHAVPHPEKEDRLFLPQGTPREKADELRAQGWIAVMALEDGGDEEARRIGCTHILTENGIRQIDGAEGEGS